MQHLSNAFHEPLVIPVSDEVAAIFLSENLLKSARALAKSTDPTIGISRPGEWLDIEKRVLKIIDPDFDATTRVDSEIAHRFLNIIEAAQSGVAPKLPLRDSEFVTELIRSRPRLDTWKKFLTTKKFRDRVLKAIYNGAIHSVRTTLDTSALKIRVRTNEDPEALISRVRAMGTDVLELIELDS